MKLYDPFLNFQTEVLPNGLTVKVLHQPDHSWVAAGLVVHAGAFHDPGSHFGAAHFVEHLASENVPGLSVREVEDFFENVGGSVNLGCTSYLWTRYKFFLPLEERLFKRSCDLFGLMLFQPDICLDFAERERRVILQEFRRRFEFDYQFDWYRQISSAMYPNLPEKSWMQPLGTQDSISSITAEVLCGFYREHCTPANSTLVVVGGFSLGEVVKMLKHTHLAEEKKGCRNPQPEPLLIQPVPSTRKLFLSLGDFSTKPVDYFDCSYALSLPGAFKDDPLVRVVCTMVYDLLFDTLRQEKKWTYAVQAQRSNMTSVVSLGLGGTKFNLGAIEEIEGVMTELVSSLVEKVEMFEKYRQKRLHSLPVYDASDQDTLEYALNDLSDHQRLISLTETRDRLLVLGPDDFQNFCQYLEPGKGLFVIKGP